MTKDQMREIARRHNYYPQHWTEDEILAAIEEAVSLEREWCAKLCETNKYISGGPGPLFGAGWNAGGEACAAAIRQSEG